MPVVHPVIRGRSSTSKSDGHSTFVCVCGLQRPSTVLCAAYPITPHHRAVHECAKLRTAVGQATELGPTDESQQRRPPEDMAQLLCEDLAALWPFEDQVDGAAERESASNILDLEGLVMQQFARLCGRVRARTVHPARAVHDCHRLPNRRGDSRQ